MTTTKEESAQRIGTYVNGKWRLDALIGFSSVAATYRAAHRNGLECALKIIHRSQTSSEKMIERFLQEAHLANRIEHPGVEKIFDDGMTEDGCVFLVMELLEGETLELRRMAAGGALRLLDARPIFDDLLDILIAIHAAGVIHRNLKPANIFLTKDKRVILTDFGRARLSDVDVNQQNSLDGLVTGTPAYMPPEQARGRRLEIDERSDIWSAGAILYTLLSGRRVHEAKTTAEKLLLAQTKPARPIMSIMPDIAAPLAHVVDRALKFDKKDRWPSASEMRKAYWRATGRDETSLPKEPVAQERLQMPDTPSGDWPPITPRPRSGTGDVSIRPGIRPSDPSLRPAARVPSDPSLRPGRPGSNPSFGPVATSFRPPTNPSFMPASILRASRPDATPLIIEAPPISSDGKERVDLRASMSDASDDPGLLPPSLDAFVPQAAPPKPKPPSKVRLYIAIVIALIFVGFAVGLVAIMYGVEEKKPPPVIELQ